MRLPRRRKIKSLHRQDSGWDSGSPIVRLTPVHAAAFPDRACSTDPARVPWPAKINGKSRALGSGPDNVGHGSALLALLNLIGHGDFHVLWGKTGIAIASL